MLLSHSPADQKFAKRVKSLLDFDVNNSYEIFLTYSEDIIIERSEFKKYFLLFLGALLNIKGKFIFLLPLMLLCHPKKYLNNRFQLKSLFLNRLKIYIEKNNNLVLSKIYFQKLILACKPSFFPLIYNINYYEKFITDNIEKYNIKKIIIFEENILLFFPILVKIARDKSIDLIVIPFTSGIKNEFMSVLPRTGYRFLDFLENQIIKRIYPDQYVVISGKRVFFPRLIELLLCDYYEIPCEDAWSGFFGCSDLYLLTNATNLAILKNLVSDISKVKLIEPLEVTACKKKGLAQEKVGGNELNILVCFPPNQFPLRYKNKCEFKNYKDIVKYFESLFVSLISEFSPVNITLLPHPRFTDIKFTNAYYPKISTSSKTFEDLIGNFQLAILFNSGLVNSALYLGKPVIDFNIYNYKYLNPVDTTFADYYHSVRSVYEFEHKLRSFLHGPTHKLIQMPDRKNLLHFI